MRIFLEVERQIFFDPGKGFIAELVRFLILKLIIFVNMIARKKPETITVASLNYS